jgi:hypothetical protein
MRRDEHRPPRPRGRRPPRKSRPHPRNPPGIQHPPQAERGARLNTDQNQARSGKDRPQRPGQATFAREAEDAKMPAGHPQCLDGILAGDFKKDIF